MDIRRYLSSDSVKKYDRLVETEKLVHTGDTGEEKECEGYIFAPPFDPETARYAFHDWTNMKDGAVYIVNYPKTGNHWVYEIAKYLLYMHDEEQLKVAQSLDLLTYLDFPDSNKFEIFDQLPLKRHLFRTHMPEKLFDMDGVKRRKGKVIYILRNPKDQAVSWYNFAQDVSFKNRGYPKDWSQFLDEYMQGKHHLWTKEGQWYPDYILDWWKYKDDKDVLFIHFEDMKKDSHKEIRRIASFLEIDLTDEKAEEVVRKTTVQAMQKKMNKDQQKYTRKGKSGGWKTWFTVAQSEMMDKLIDKKLAGTGIKFTYEL